VWQIRHNRQFYKELARIPSPLREKIEKIAFGEEIKKNPFGSGMIEKLTGYRKYYKITFGSTHSMVSNFF